VRLYGFSRCAIPVQTVDARPLQELTIANQLIKALVVNEEVVHALHFTRPGSPGGCGDAHDELRVLFSDRGHNRAFTDPRRSHKDDEFASVMGEVATIERDHVPPKPGPLTNS
jgi:hypothetical protein